MMRPFHVALVETEPTGQKGSMLRYADLLTHVLCSEQSASPVKILRINLALSNKLLSNIPIFFRSWMHHIWIMFSAIRWLPKIDADIFHVVDGSQAYIARWLPRNISVASCHDIIPLLQLTGRLDGRPLRRSSRWLIKQSIETLGSVKHIIADSDNTARDLNLYANINSGKMSVVHPAVPPEITSKANSLVPIPWHERRNSKQVYILYVGNNAFYKNRKGLLRVFSRIISSCNVELKIAGPAPNREERELIRQLGINNNVTFIINPKDQELFNLYLKACLFIFPSLYEGFGWPPLEAMAFGCPVVCSSAASLPEVVGDAALTSAPDDEEQIAQNCLTVLQNESVANHLIKLGHSRIKKFTSERMGRQIMDVYSKVLHEGSC